MKMYFQDCSRNLYFTAQLRFTKLRKITKVNLYTLYKYTCIVRAKTIAQLAFQSSNQIKR